MQAQCKQCWDADVATPADDFDDNDDAIDNADKGNDLYRVVFDWSALKMTNDLGIYWSPTKLV